MYSAIQIANYFIKLSKKDNKPVDNMKLQKLVYIAYGFYLGYYDEYLINETPEAWKYGPVIYSLYHALKHYGNKSVNDYCSEITYEKDDFKETIPMLDEKNEKVVDFLKIIWNTYKEFDGWQLSNLTHQKGSPWDTTIEEYSKRGLTPVSSYIKPELIKDYYKSKISSIGK